MSFTVNRIQCDQCKTSISVPFPAGVIVLLEMPGEPMRTPITEWPTYHFCNFEELRGWQEDKEQVVGA